MKYLLVIVLLLISLPQGWAQAAQPLVISSSSQQLLLDTTYFRMLEDKSGTLTLRQVQEPGYARQFAQLPGQPFTMRSPGAVYWLRLQLRNDDKRQTRWFLELFDPHIAHVTMFRPVGAGRYDSSRTGAAYAHGTRLYHYRDFVFPLDKQLGLTQTYYLRLQSESKTSFRAIVWNEQDLVGHVHNESTWLGIFYGILGIMVLYNLCLYLFIGERAYLHYVLYVLGCALLFLSEDGLGFEYLWPTQPALNQLINKCAPLILLGLFVVYSRSFLDTAQLLPRYDVWLKRITVLSLLIIGLDVLLLQAGYSLWLYLFPYGACYVAAVRVQQQGFKPARYYLATNALVAFSVVFLITRKLGIELWNDHIITVYSMNLAFVLEVVVLSYALGEKIKGIKDATLLAQERLVKQLRKKHRAQQQLVEQLRQNQELKDQLNTELEGLVAQRTSELHQQADTIAAQNRELVETNGLMTLQAEAIAKLNQELQRDLQQTQEARVLSRSVNFSEFSRMYPDREACLHYLAELKWTTGFHCRKCGHERSCDAREPYAQRCTRCGYVESATAYTLLHRCKFDTVKALYAVFLVHIHQGQYSALELSQVLQLRQATCWSFIQKVQLAMQQRQQAADYDKAESWTRVLLEDNQSPETAADEAEEYGLAANISG